MVPINLLAILACGVVAIVIGFLWFGPLFGKAWMRLSFGSIPSPEQMAEGKKKMPLYAFIQFVLALVMAFVLAHNLAFGDAYLTMTGIAGGIQAGFWNWLGFVVPTTVGMVLWEGKPWKLWLIIVSEWLLTLLLMGIILAIWP